MSLSKMVAVDDDVSKIVPMASINSMEKQDVFNGNVFMPSMEYAAALNIVTTLFKQPDITEMMKQHTYTNSNELLHKLEEMLLEKLSQVGIPNSLRNKALGICNLVACQANYWWLYDLIRLECNNPTLSEYVQCIKWNMDGSINKANTLSLILKRNKHSNLEITEIFAMACYWCLEDVVLQCWEKIPQELRESLLQWKEWVNLTNNYGNQCSAMIMYWVYLINGKLPLFASNLVVITAAITEAFFPFRMTHFEEMLKFTVSNSNLDGAKYFWGKLTQEEKGINVKTLIGIAARDINIWVLRGRPKTTETNRKRIIESLDIVFFLLSQTSDKELQTKILRQFIRILLIASFENLPCQKYIAPIIQFVLNSLDEQDFYNILTAVLTVIGDGQNLNSLFKEIWMYGSKDLRKRFVQNAISDGRLKECAYGDWNPFKLKSLDILKLILSDSTDTEKRDYLSLIVRIQVYDMIYEDFNQLDVIDNFICSVMSSKEEIVKLREKIVNGQSCTLLRRWIFHDNWELADKFLAWGFTTQVQIKNYKKNFTVVDNIYRVMKLFDPRSCTVRKCLSWGSFMKLLEWSFEEEEDMTLFKRHTSDLFAGFPHEMERLIYSDYEFMNNILNYCLTPDQILEFKKANLLSPSLKTIIRNIILLNIKNGVDENGFKSLGERLGEWFGHVGEELARKLRNDFGIRAFTVPPTETEWIMHAIFLDKFISTVERLNGVERGLCVNNQE